MKFKEETLKEKVIYNGKIINVKKDEVLLPNGKTATREYVEHCGGSAVICEKDGKILLVKQFRYPYKREIWEIPAGKLNRDESPEQTAIRELEEEGGIIAERLEKLFVIYPSPAYTNEKIYVYRVTSFKNSSIRLDEDEFLESKWFSREEIKKMIDAGEINDSKTLVALLRVL